MGTGHRQKMPLAGGSSGLDGPALTDAVVRSMEAGDGLSEAQFNALALAVFRYSLIAAATTVGARPVGRRSA